MPDARSSLTSVGRHSAPGSHATNTVEPRLLRGRSPRSSSESTSRSMPAPKPIAGGRRAADLLDEVVVAAAAADRRRLRALVRADELEGGAAVVVEAAHERRVEVVRHAVRVEVRAHRGEVLGAFVAERVADLRCVLQRREHLLGFFTSKTRSGLVARFCRASSSRASWCASSHAFSFSTYCGRQLRSPIELSWSSYSRHAEIPQQRVVELDHLRVDAPGRPSRCTRARAGSARGKRPRCGAA